LCRQTPVVRITPSTTISTEIWDMTIEREIREATYYQDRPVPDGYTEDYDCQLWNVGHVFRWSDVYEAWLDCEVRLSIKPNMTIGQAFAEQMDHPMWLDYSVFFVEGF
jgi:hypothetical protein